ncbi:MAG: nucleotidyltransferase domain-containing protein [Coriobacteriales bacterium]|jgi:predicted nucleotidyltransferase|nr:nucleotidyltransferase domain-containing protein [Coriobacteriales bacterium]
MLSVETVKDAVCDLAFEHGISKAILFGSFARGEATDSSDVDLVIELAEPLGFKRGRICLDLESRIGHPVDLVFGVEQLYPPIRERFESDKVVIYER